MRSSGSFITGILIGVLAAFGIVFLWQMDFSWLPFGGTKSKSQDADTVLDLTVQRAAQRAGKPSRQGQNTTNWGNESTQPMDSAISVNDSLSAMASDADETIVVRRDELISSTVTTLIQLSASSKTDSLLTLFQGGNPSAAPQIRLEFWKSPVNFRGYKFIRNTLVTFGLDPQEQVKIYLDNGLFYLQSGAATYRLNQTDRFLPFSTVAEESLPKQIRS
jgi:hypothetical protein